MEGKDARTSRRDALKRMAKASVGIGMGLQLVGAFVPQGAHAAAPAGQGTRFSTLGQECSPADSQQAAARENVLRSCGVYTNGGSYAQNGYTQYGKYANYVNDGNCN